MEVAGRVKTFSFEMATTRFTLRIEIVSLEGSRLWQADRAEGGDEVAAFDGSVASALIYVPYVHYLASLQPPERPSKRRLFGRPSKDGEEWVKGKGPALVDLEIEQLSEGRLEVEGQWMRWYYPLRREGEREISLRLRKWKG